MLINTRVRAGKKGAHLPLEPLPYQRSRSAASWHIKYCCQWLICIQLATN